ncbi:MFS transporter [Brevundimonas sp. PAMC22021]|uniref:MFS transporter n=1 Tax=Brevundimonas sp. PAMC22021 TaxID=2861285 RepID=UPI002105C559|nr:MFS transporter [Brevundimonas sp. PAMC22021]
MSSATPELIHAHRPRLSRLAIWNMCVGFFGIQIGFGLQNANTSRIFQTLGAEVDSLAILWIAAPLTGLLVQPIIGHFSDRTWTRFGRRRPYFLVGAILTTLALIAMPNSPSLWFAAAMLWIMDASINITMEPFRAFVGDNLPEEQRTAGYAMQSFFIGAGAVFASVLPWLLSNVFDVASTAPEGAVPLSVRIAFYVGAAGLFAAVLWTVLSTKEYSPEQIAAFEQARGVEPVAPGEEPPARSVQSWLTIGLICAVLGGLAFLLIGLMDLEKELLILAGFALGFGLLLVAVGMMQRRRITNAATEIVNDVFRMPATMRGLAVVQFFSWFALFAMWIYTTAAVTSVHYGATDTTSAAYNAGADWVGVLMGVYNGVAALAAFALPVLARRIGRKATHAVMLLFGAAGLAGVFLIREPSLLWLPMVGVGFAWASIVSMPYAILSGAVPDRKMGVYMGVFNIFIVVPQLLAATVLGLILRTVFDGQAIYALLLGAASFVLAAISALLVKEHRA